MDQPILISIEECARLLGICRKSVYDRIKNDPNFPQPIKVGRCTRIVLAELLGWIAAKSKRAAAAAQLRRQKIDRNRSRGVGGAADQPSGYSTRG